MQNEHKFALLLARLVELMGSDGDAGDRRAALHALVDAANMRSATVRLEDGLLTVEGIKAPQDVPFVQFLVKRMKAHDVAEVRVPHRAAPIDIMEFVVALNAEPRGLRIPERLARAGVYSLQVVTGEAAQVIAGRRKQHIPDEMFGVTTIRTPEDLERGMPSDFVPAKKGAAFDQMLELKRASSTTLAAAVKRLRDVHDDAMELSKGLNAIVHGVIKAVREQREPEAIDAILAVIAQENEEEREEVKVRYGVALRRILQSEVLQPLIRYLLDPLYMEDVARILRRSGTRGTELLLNRLVQARTFAERRAFMEALRQIEAGTDLLVAMLNHKEWFVVRNVADLCGEMQIEEAVPALGQAVQHEDNRVRLSAGLALAKIGTPSAVKFLGNLIHDEDHRVRLEVAKHVAGRGLAALAMPLVNAVDTEEDDKVRFELYRALGRIGTNDAIQALLKATKPKGILHALRSDGNRLAATQGLAFAGGKTALAALAELAHDRDKHVREAAKKGLEQDLPAAADSS